MVFGHKVKGSFPIEKFEEDLRNHTFIKNLEVLPFTAKPLYVKAVNSFLAIKAYLASILPSAFGTTLTETIFEDEKTISAEDKQLLSLCKRKNKKDEKPVVMVNINRNQKTNTDNEKYVNEVVMNIFPIIGSRIFIAGEVQSEYWDMIGLVRYPSQKKLCEMVFSEEYRKIKHLKANGLDDAYTSMTATVLSYQKDLLE